MYFKFRKKSKCKLITGAQLELIFFGGGGLRQYFFKNYDKVVKFPKFSDKFDSLLPTVGEGARGPVAPKYFRGQWYFVLKQWGNVTS